MIQTEQTPNPTLEILIGFHYFFLWNRISKKEIEKIDNKFIKELLEFKGVELVLLSDKFITVKKMMKVLGCSQTNGDINIKMTSGKK